MLRRAAATVFFLLWGLAIPLLLVVAFLPLLASTLVRTWRLLHGRVEAARARRRLQ
ncbi:hypothetical protein [Engelhardtia mirabilis]|uniref:Uncharacterized protein n=1 Tax=Engelhardtia mirabilis TaxID=2528011 RepID=A0A518BI04_9BACT|nr:hypothetical protein Pla133_16720 [Planctomycetes bacterium Pla133]QDV00922.1 hypothetical protein Pla86_16710 [Planctomycetes bacterium Pla86]